MHNWAKSMWTPNIIYNISTQQIGILTQWSFISYTYSLRPKPDPQFRHKKLKRTLMLGQEVWLIPKGSWAGQSGSSHQTGTPFPHGHFMTGAGGGGGGGIAELKHNLAKTNCQHNIGISMRAKNKKKYASVGVHILLAILYINPWPSHLIEIKSTSYINWDWPHVNVTPCSCLLKWIYFMQIYHFVFFV